jgi:aromatic amino acid aminotransferase I
MTKKPDVIIVEDDPYFFIQYSAYDIATPASYKIQTNEDFTSSLEPSFLRYDYQGRVIRLESFSKSLAPGLRLGYFVANSLFSERLLRATEVETQDPAGLSQAVVLALLRQWTVHGYLTWLQNLRNQYQMRRDWMINAFSQHFQLLPAAQFPELKAEGMVAAIRAESMVTPIFSFVSPTGGMFIWCKFYLTENPRFKELKALDQVDDPEQTFADELWKTLAQNLVRSSNFLLKQYFHGY